MENFLYSPTRKIVAGVVAAILFALVIASCSGSSQPYAQPTVASAQPQYEPQPQVVQPGYVQQAPVVVQQSNHDGLFTGMLLGHMLGGGGSRSTVVERHTTVVQPPRYAPVAPAQRYGITPYAAQRPTVTTSVRPTSGGGQRISVSSSRRR